MAMNRRTFLDLGARVAGGLMLLPGLRGILRAEEQTGGELGASEPAADWPDIVLARGEARDATLMALAAIGGMERFVKPGQVVAIKPNASFAKPAAWGATTHPEVLGAVLEACFTAEARRVYVIDHTMANPERCFQRNGTAEAVAAFPKAKLVSLDKEKAYRSVELPKGKALKSTAIPALLQKADVFINLPTAKSHNATGVSLGFKNLMGLVWDRNHFHNEIDLQLGIADLGLVLRPHLTILDAMKILRTGGPTGPGKVEDFGGVVAGVDPVAVDAYGVGLSTWNNQTLRPEQLPFIRQAAAHGLGSMDLSSLRIEERAG